MKPFLYLLQKDFRRYLWAVVALLVLSGLSVFLFGTDFGLRDTGGSRSLILLAGTGFVLLAYFLIVLVVQEESLADPDAYWLTRPLPRFTVLSAKIVFFVIVVAGFGVVSESITLWLNDGARRIPYAIASGGWVLVFVFFQIFLAAQTPSLPRYLLLLVILVLGLVALQFTVFTVWIRAFDVLDRLGILPADMPGHVVGTIQGGFWLLFLFGVLLFYYWKRQRAVAWIGFLPAAFFALLLTPSDSGLFRTEMEDISVELVDDELFRGGTHTAHGRTHVIYRGRVGIEGVPEGADIWATVWSPGFTVDGRDLEVEEIGASQRAAKVGEENGVPVYEIDLFSLEERELPAEGETGELRGFLRLAVSRQVEHRTLPVTDGAGFVHEGNRVRVLNISRGDGELRISLGAYLPRFMTEPSPPGSFWEPLNGIYSFALYNPEADEVADGRIESLYYMGMDGAQLRFAVSEESNAADRELIVFRRQGIGETQSRLRAGEVRLAR